MMSKLMELQSAAIRRETLREELELLRALVAERLTELG
jgi:hypothetical protein